MNVESCALHYANSSWCMFFRRKQIAFWQSFDFQFVGKTTEISQLRDSRPGIKTLHTVSTAVRCLSTLRSRVCGEARCSCHYTRHGITVSWSVMFITAGFNPCPFYATSCGLVANFTNRTYPLTPIADLSSYIVLYVVLYCRK